MLPSESSSPGQETAIFRRPLDNSRILISRIPTDEDLSKVFQSICKISSTALSVDRVGIWLLVNNRTSIRCVCLFERSKQLFSEGATLRVSDFPNYFAGLKVRKTLPASDAAHDPNTNELLDNYLAPLGITSMLDAPILIDGQMQGVVCHEHVGAPREWSIEERDFAGSVADSIALKMKTAETARLQQMLPSGDSDRATIRQRETLQTMAAGVAHDFRTFLVIISNYAEEISSLPNLDPEVAKFIEQIQATVDRGCALTDELTEIASERARHPCVLNIHEHLIALLPALRNIIGDHHQLDLRSQPDVGRVFIEPSQFDRVIMNLVVNARDAMRKGGPITISVSGGPTRSDGQITLAVIDQGEGIDPAHLDRIFDPFFTTKPRGRGTGLGLPIVRQAVEHAGGSLRVQSELGRGTTFTITLPRVSGA